jgi:hypothetical protein
LPGRLWADALAALASTSKALAIPTTNFMKSPLLAKARARATVREARIRGGLWLDQRMGATNPRACVTQPNSMYDR